MASARSSVALVCVIALLLVADVAAVPELPQQQAAQVTGSAKQFYLRGEVMSKFAENAATAEENLESFERRELSDYGASSSRANCSRNCK